MHICVYYHCSLIIFGNPYSKCLLKPGDVSKQHHRTNAPCNHIIDISKVSQMAASRLSKIPNIFLSIPLSLQTSIRRGRCQKQIFMGVLEKGPGSFAGHYLKNTILFSRKRFSGPYQYFCYSLQFPPKSPSSRIFFYLLRHVLDLENQVNTKIVFIDVLNEIKT